MAALLVLLSALGFGHVLVINFENVAYLHYQANDNTRELRGRLGFRLFAESSKCGWSNNSRRYVLASRLATAAADDEAAIRHMERAVSLDPTDEVTCLRLGEAYYRRDNEQRALIVWRHCRGLDHFLARGAEARQRGDRHGARQYLEIATKLDANSHEAWLRLGDALVTLEQLEPAARSYYRAIRVQESATAGYERLARLYYFLMRRPKDAVAVLVEGISRASHPSSGLSALRALMVAKPFEGREGKRDVSNELARSPASGDELIWLGDVHYGQGHFVDALAKYRNAAEKAEDSELSWVAHQRTGQVYATLEQWDLAITHYMAALTVSLALHCNPATVSKSYTAYCEALARAGHEAERVPACRVAERHTPGNREASERLGEALRGRVPR